MDLSAGIPWGSGQGRRVDVAEGRVQCTSSRRGGFDVGCRIVMMAAFMAAFSEAREAGTRVTMFDRDVGVTTAEHTRPLGLSAAGKRGLGSAYARRAHEEFSFFDKDDDGVLSRAEMHFLKRRFYQSELSNMNGEQVARWLATPSCMPDGCRVCGVMAQTLRTSHTPLPGLVLFDLAFRRPENLREVGLTTEKEQATLQLAVLMEIQGHWCLKGGKGLPDAGGGGWWWGSVAMFFAGPLCVLVAWWGGSLRGEGWRGEGWRGARGSMVVEKEYRAGELSMPEVVRRRAAQQGVSGGQMGLKVGDKVTVVDPVRVQEGFGGWAYGVCEDSKGWFPISFCVRPHVGSKREASLASVGKRWTWPGDRRGGAQHPLGGSSRRVTFEEPSSEWDAMFSKWMLRVKTPSVKRVW